MRAAVISSAGDHGQALDGGDGSDNLTLALRGVAARFRLKGVEDSALRRLHDRYLPDAPRPHEGPGPASAGMDEFEDLVALLLAHRSDDREETEWLACAIATACAGNDHLWQDMGLPSRKVLSELLHEYFTALHEKNTGNMKWKKFFYKQLCDRGEVRVCKAPSCALCSDYHQCFGPEEDDGDSNRYSQTAEAGGSAFLILGR